MNSGAQEYTLRLRKGGFPREDVTIRESDLIQGEQIVGFHEV